MVKALMNTLLIVLIGPLLMVPLGVGLLILRYIEDGLEWITSHHTGLPAWCSS